MKEKGGSSLESVKRFCTGGGGGGGAGGAEKMRGGWVAIVRSRCVMDRARLGIVVVVECGVRCSVVVVMVLLRGWSVDVCCGGGGGGGGGRCV